MPPYAFLKADELPHPFELSLAKALLVERLPGPRIGEYPICPDGFSLEFAKFIGLDQIGTTGMAMKVNHGYLEAFAAAAAIGGLSKSHREEERDGQHRYVGMDVHKETVSIAVRNQARKIVMDTVIETGANAILDCIRRIRGELHITFEQGTWAAWLYDLLHPPVAHVVVCDPRRNLCSPKATRETRSTHTGLRHCSAMAGCFGRSTTGEHSLRSLRELARSYLVITQDVTRVMNRTRALYRG